MTATLIHEVLVGADSERELCERGADQLLWERTIAVDQDHTALGREADLATLPVAYTRAQMPQLLVLLALAIPPALCPSGYTRPDGTCAYEPVFHAWRGKAPDPATIAVEPEGETSGACHKGRNMTRPRITVFKRKSGTIAVQLEWETGSGVGATLDNRYFGQVLLGGRYTSA